MAFSGGVGTYLRELVPFFNAPPFRVILLVSEKDQAWCKGIEQIVFPLPIYSIQEQISFPRIIPQCDLFWSPHYNVPLLPIRAKKKVATIHDACHLALGKFLSFPQRCYAKLLMKRALHHSDALITGSLFSKNELIRFLGKPKKEFSIIPHAVNQKIFYKIKDEKSFKRVKKKYGLNEKFLLFVGNLKPHKNLKNLLEAFSYLNESKLHLVIVGKRKGMRNVVEAHFQENVIWLEDVLDEELSLLYNLAEAFVFPSLYEGFGLPPLEAMNCGCPTIVSTAASLPEVCLDAACYVNPQNPLEMAKGIQEVLGSEELRMNLVAKGYERAAHFNWEKAAVVYRDLLMRLLSS